MVTIIILQAIIFGGFSAWIAKQKNRDPLNWFLFGLFFSLIALIAIAVSSPLKGRTNFLDEDTKRLRDEE